VLQAVGPALGVVSGHSAGYTSWPLSALLALLPVIVAVAFVGSRRPGAAAALVMVFAAVAVGRAVSDVQLAVDAVTTSRPDLVVVPDALSTSPSIGLWLLFAGYILAVVAGVLALREQPPGDEDPRRGLVVAAAVFGVLVAVGVVMAPFGSSNPLLPANSVFDAPAIALVGGLLIALAMPVAATVAASSGDADTTRGGLVGVGLAAVVVLLPPAVAGYVVTDLHATAGPYVALVGVVLLWWSAFVSVGRREQSLDDVDLPGRGKLHVVTGVFGLLAAVSAVLAVSLPLLSLPDGSQSPSNFAIRVLAPAGVLTGVLAVGLLVPRWAAVVRPAFVVASVGIPLAVASAFDAVLSATRISSIVPGGASAVPGPGVWVGALAVLLTLVAAVTATLAGALEREDVDLSELVVRPAVAVPTGIGVLLVILAFGFPAVTGPDYSSAGLWSFRFASTGLLLGLVAVVVAGVLAVRSRPSRAAALLFGSAALLALRALEYPLTADRVPGSTPALGTWMSVLCAVILIVAGAVSLVSKPTRD
jgi:hypothetical protein